MVIIYLDLLDKSIGLPPGEYSYFEVDDKYVIIRDTDIFTYKKMLEIINKHKSEGFEVNTFIPKGILDLDNDIEYNNKENIL